MYVGSMYIHVVASIGVVELSPASLCSRLVVRYVTHACMY